MKRLSATLLALGLVAAVGSASAQSGYYGSDPYRNTYNQGTSTQNQAYPDRYGSNAGAIYDCARVVRVVDARCRDFDAVLTREPRVRLADRLRRGD